MFTNKNVAITKSAYRAQACVQTCHNRALCLTITLALSIILASLWMTRIFAKGGHDGGAGAMPPALVEVAKVQHSTTYDTLAATGTLAAIPGITAKPEIAGRITNIYFKSGDKVAAGTPLIEIYPDIIKAQLTQAQAELKLAELEFDRYTKLYATRTVSKSDYDKAKASLETGRGKVESCQASLAQTIVRAPFAGSLGVVQVSLGQYITAGQNIVSLQALNPIYVDFSVPEIFSSKVAAGQIVNLHVGAYPKEKFAGRLQAIDPLVSQKTRSFTVRATIPNKDEKLLPGTFADVTLFTSGEKQIIKIPQTAIVYDPQGNYVYKVVGGKAAKALVTLGERDASSVVVQSGLNDGDTVVTAGQMKIAAEGTPVIVMPPPAEQATKGASLPAKAPK